MKKEYISPMAHVIGVSVAEPLCTSVVGAAEQGYADKTDASNNNYATDYGKERSGSDGWSSDGLW